ncbi:MAG: hypothetical protein IJH38_08690 [Clostridia bacterium]|nr:hypothetical protein [Clostridia bacterium]
MAKDYPSIMPEAMIMRCSCHVCDTYMVQSEGLELGCVCPQCGYRCKACLGTDSVLRRDQLSDLASNASLMQEIFSSFDADPDSRERDTSPDKWEDGQYID